MPTYFRIFVVENLLEKMLKNLLYTRFITNVRRLALPIQKMGKASRGRGVARQSTSKNTRERESSFI